MGDASGQAVPSQRTCHPPRVRQDESDPDCSSVDSESEESASGGRARDACNVGREVRGTLPRTEGQ
eukprot:9684167-Alexandrium_andersonii.AAC.1